VKAQFAYFPTKGTIHFEKVDHPKARVRQMMNSQPNSRGSSFWGNIDLLEETKTSAFVLTFDQTQSLMKPVEETAATAGASAPRIGGRGQGAAINRNRGTRGFGAQNMRNIYYQNIKNATSKVQIELDEIYVLEDSLQEITWRFTDEYRDIAGYECRRVNGATKDSLYLVAFYTDQIPLSSGPVMVNGLPGMILGLAIPEMHINYWATKVEFSNVDVERSWQDKKAKNMETKAFAELILRQINRSNPNQQQSQGKFIEQLYY